MAKDTTHGQGWRLKFDSSQFEGDIAARLEFGVATAAIFLTGELKKDVSLPGPPPRTVTRRQKKARKERAEKLGQTLRHSKPGEPPRVVTGHFRESIANEPVEGSGGLVQRVGTPVKHGFWLEYGTVKMDPRPWLLPGLRKNLTAIRSIIGKALGAKR
jgi:hypothetical protein